MAIFEVPRVFEVVLPDGWVASQWADDQYEIVPPNAADVAITITVLPKAPKGSSSATAARNFAKGLGVADVEKLRVVTPRQRGQERSFIRLSVDGHAWFIGWLLFRRAAVIATANGDPQAVDAMSAAELIIASIVPR